jgi:D-glycero-D-manno-heptose 1,7-bisphosphate phosphatase
MGIGVRMKGAAVFLDRDGVINRALVRDGLPYPPASLEGLEVLPEVPCALGKLRALGFRLIVVTNQPDVARGRCSRQAVERMHAHLMATLALDAIFTCYHDSADDCSCRKPRAGLLLQAARVQPIDLGASYMVGDRWRDIEAGQRAGCSTIFVDHAYREPPPVAFDHRVGSLLEAATIIDARARRRCPA